MFTAQQYVIPATLEEAYQLNQKKNNAVLGGGCWLRLGQRRLHTIIDLSDLGLDQIQEEPEQFRLGAMVTLRQLERHPGLAACFGGGFADMVRHIVGVQFRNCATLGGSVAARMGFSDILSFLLALDCQVELYGAGQVPLADYAEMPPDRDVLSHVTVAKNGRRAVYESFRNTQTDLSVLTCALSALEGRARLVIGARPGRAQVLDGLSLAGGPDALAQAAQEHFTFEDNMRASAQYRRHLAGVLVRRAAARLLEEVEG